MLYQRKSLTFSQLLVTSILMVLSASSYSATSNYSKYRPYNISSPSYFSSFDTNWSFGTATKKGEFNWNIASDATGKATPNILSELSYKNLVITEGTGAVNFRKTKGALSGFMMEAKLNAGTVSSGNIQDSDFDANNRTNEYNRSNSNPQGSSTVGASGSIGYPIYNNAHIQSNFLAGYALNEQQFLHTDGHQVLSSNHSRPLAAYANLESQYDAKWQGPWIGGTFSWQQADHKLGLRVEQHWPSYYAQANWNLREELAHPKSFDQVAQGSGHVIELSYSYALTKQLHLTAQAHHEVWKTDAGIDTLYYANGASVKTRLNGANWTNDGLSIGIVFK